MTESSTQAKRRWRHLLPPRPLDWVTALTYVGVLGVYCYFSIFWSSLYRNDHPWWGLTILSLGVLLVMGLDRLEYGYDSRKKSWRTTAAFSLARVTLIGVTSLSDGLGFGCLGKPCQILLLLFFGLFFVSGSRYGLTGLFWVLYLVGRVRVAEGVARGDIWPSNEQSTTYAIVFFLVLAIIYAIAYLVRREQAHRVRVEKLLNELWVSHQQLQGYARQVAELTAIEERNRLARDIHDGLGHYMTVINVQLEKALAFWDRDPQQARQAVRDAKRSASESLQDIRRSVGALRDTATPFSLSAALKELVDNASHGQFGVELKIEGDETGFSRHALMTLYRAAQEGLTNVQKHAQASHATVRVYLDAQQASLCVDDDGRGFDPAVLDETKAASHYGLQGLRERLGLVRGSLELESAPGKGTSLRMTIPKGPLAPV